MRKIYIVISYGNDVDQAVIEASSEEDVIRFARGDEVKVYRAEDVKQDSGTMAKILASFGSKALNEVLESKAFYMEIAVRNRGNGEKKLFSIIRKAFTNLSSRRM